MQIIAVNRIPRKTKNTATLLEKALEGAKSQGAEIVTIPLYIYNYRYLYNHKK